MNTIFNHKKKIDFRFIIILSLFFSTISSKAQSDCSDAIIACGNTGFEGLTVTGIGAQELSGLNTCSSEENNSIWLKISIKKGGSLGFTLKPESTNINEDFDFFVFGPNASCDMLGQAIRCSTTNPRSINQNNNFTGMEEDETDTSEGPGANGNSFVKWLTVDDGDSYYLVVDRPIGSSNFSLHWTGTATFNSAPTFDVPNGFALDLNQCDNDGIADFSTTIDLTKNTSKIIGSQGNVIVTYHIEQNDALTNTNPIINTTQFINTSNPQNIFARITNTSTGCFSTSDFNITVNELIKFPITEFSICDDAKDGNDSNGQSFFDLNTVTSEIFGSQNTNTFTIKYYLTENEATNDSNPLPQFFYNTIPNLQSIYIKASSPILCTAISKIKLIVTPLPLKTNAVLVQCDTGFTPDGISLFNLNEVNEKFTNNNPDLITALFINDTDAQNNTNELNISFYNTVNPQSITVRVTNNKTGCSSLSTLELKVNVIPEKIYTINPVCDADGIEDGKHLFNLKEANIPTTSTQTLYYYSNINDALLEQNELTNPFSYFNETAYNQIIYARIEDGNDCFGISKIKLEVLKLPDLNTVIADTFVCSNLPTFFIQLNSGIPDGSPSSDYTYAWSKDGTPLTTKTASTLDVSIAGLYAVEVKNNSGCSKIRTMKVTASDVAKITNIAITDLSDVNSITINVSGQGQYEYSLDAPSGPFQDSNFFDNITAGIHEVYINDKNGCGTVSQTIAVIGVPKFFTPNGDGQNDFWNVKGVNNTFNANSTIYIYDRYGKLIKQITATSQGWDGTFTGQPLPSDDYWYSIILEDGREAKGHFSLKR
jgi:gliding motility-associated-like protein